jgi:hypothetical protein
MNAKGTAKYATHLKPMAGGATLRLLYIGDYVYGNLGTTDITGFTHFYQADGTIVELEVLCKATLDNLTVTLEEEPSQPPEPEQPPVDNSIIMHQRFSYDGGQNFDAGKYYKELEEAIRKTNESNP